MADYRVYFISADGGFRDVRELDCADDAGALAQAWQLVGGRDVEVWQRGRFIARLTHPLA
jgi:hypothetical protein